MNPRFAIAAIAGVALLGAAPAWSLTLDPGLYQLKNHINGNARPPAYGLRLDGLETGDSHDIYTFDFEAPGATMVMDYRVTTAHIFGTAFGGLNQGNDYANASFWKVDFIYEMSPTPNSDGYLFSINDPGNVGTISTGGETFGLSAYGGPPAFFIGEGHRTSPDIISGWGWLNHSGSRRHVYSSDWLFEVGAPIPEPTGAILFGAGLLVAGAARRREGR